MKATRRDQGIGTQLLDLAEDVSRRSRAKVLHLEVNYDHPAKELYRRRGFTEHQRFVIAKWLDG